MIPPAIASGAPDHAVRIAPEALILQASDVPADYVLETDDVMQAQQLADCFHEQKALEGRGACGYVRASKQPDPQFRCCLVDSILITTADANAGKAVFADFRASARAGARPGRTTARRWEMIRVCSFSSSRRPTAS